jgi:ATP-dependent DNA helicase RecQ
MLYNNGDAVKMRKRVNDTFPPKEFCVRVYEAIANYFEVGEGSGLDNVFAFNIMDFCIKFKLPMLMAYNAIKIIEQAGYLHLSDEDDSASRILFVVHKDDLYKQKHEPLEDSLIHLLLRSYTGLFSDYAYINEDVLAKRMNTTRDKVCEGLIQLSRERIIKYIPRKKTPYLTFTLERQSNERVVISKAAYDERRERYIKKVKSILDYAKEEAICRSQILLAYFGDTNTQACGKCDICLKNKELTVSEEEFSIIRNAVLAIVDKGNSTFNKIISDCPTSVAKQ